MFNKFSIPKLITAIAMVSHSINLFASAAAVEPMHALAALERRETSCANQTWTPCTKTDPKIFSFFCCDPGNMCLSLDHSFGSICCPKGDDCSGISTISCDISNYNVSLNPFSPVHTVRLQDSLPRCQNGQCCPFGYTCGMINGGKTVGCTINKNSTIFPAGYPNSPSSSSSASSSPSSSKSTSSGSPKSTASASASQGIDSNRSQPHPTTSRFPGQAVGLGLGLGLLFGAVLTLLAITLFGCYRRSKIDRNSASSDLSRPGTGSTLYGASHSKFGVSSPIPMAQSARTDFLRRDNSSALKRTGTKVKSWFSSASSPRQPPPAEPMPTYNPNKYHPDPANSASHWKMPNTAPNSSRAGAIPMANLPKHDRDPPSPIHDHDRDHNHGNTDNPFTPITRSPSPASPDSPDFSSPTSTNAPATPRTLHRPDSNTESIKIYTPPSMALPPNTNLPTLPSRAFESPNAAPKPLFAEISTHNLPQQPAFLGVDPMASEDERRRAAERERPNTTFTDIMQRAGFEGRR